ncbi:MAG: hypothetical protein Q9168_003780, partial [Polycauliona sp. 1 TL-2023]
MSNNWGTSPSRPRKTENRFAITPDTPANGNAFSGANGDDQSQLLAEPSWIAKPHGSERSSENPQPRRTAYPRPDYSPLWSYGNFPLTLAFDEEPSSAATPTTHSPGPPKAPGYAFGPPPLELANPDNDPEFSSAIFVPTKADWQAIRSHGTAQGQTSLKDLLEENEKIKIEARRIVAQSMLEKTSLERQHAQQRDAWHDQLERARAAANQWFPPKGATVRRPRLISDQEIEEEACQIESNGKTKVAKEDLPSAESEMHPPLYNNSPDRLRQMAVEFLLHRSKIAYALKDWKTMERTSREAYETATYFNWEPYVARCAFWIGIALYHQKNWVEAYDAFEEADRTNGYYIARRYILHWLEKTNKRMEGSPWSSAAPSTARGENPPLLTPLLTPLDTVVEETDSYPFPNKRDHDDADGGRTPSNKALPTNDQSFHAIMNALQADGSDWRRTAALHENGPGRNAPTRVAAASPKNRTSGVKPRPPAIRLRSKVAPPSERTPRLYEPQPSADLAGPEIGPSISTPPSSETFVNASQDQQQEPPSNIDLPSSPLSSSTTPTTALPSSRPPQLPTPTASSFAFPPPLSPKSLAKQQRIANLTAQRRLEESKINAAISTVKDIASPR